ncbi:nucleotide pyrophosphohydrolase, partial [Staphylococcus aureus]
LTQQPHAYARTLDHPVIKSLQDELHFESFDHIWSCIYCHLSVVSGLLNY